MTDTSAENIFYNGDFNEVVKAESEKQTKYKIGKCPSATPFYDATKNSCLKCPPSNPIYNIKYSRCVNCGKDSVYDKYSRICRSNQKISTAIER